MGMAAVAVRARHLFWLAFPLIFFFVLRPFLWQSRGFRRYGMWACGPRSRTGA
jgi:hypothetical protein